MSHLKARSVFALAALILATLSCNSALPATEPAILPTRGSTATHEAGWLPLTDADVPRVSLEETLAAIESGEAVVVDVRSTAAYEESHIVSAISIPLEVIQANPEGIGLDKDQWIITYCT
jgi:3-mercaptopyruvate sulfurtransferase SseA